MKSPGRAKTPPTRAVAMRALARHHELYARACLSQENHAMKRMMAEAQSGYHGWGECFHRFWLAEEESHTWAMVPEPQRQVLLDTTIPGCAYEIGSIDGARGESSTRALMGLAGLPGAKHLVLSARPGVGSQRCLSGLRAVLERIGFTTSILTKGGHLAPLMHPAETAEHVARLVCECDS